MNSAEKRAEVFDLSLAIESLSQDVRERFAIMIEGAQIAMEVLVQRGDDDAVG